jgi:hypothetical protein
VLGQFKQGDVVRIDGGFQSSSTSAEIAVENFSEGDDLRLEIVGARGVWMRTITHTFEHEHEWLIDSNATFEVIGKRRFKYKDGRMIEFLQVRELDDEVAKAARLETERKLAEEAAKRAAAEKAAEAAKKAKLAALQDVSSWKKVGEQAGSNPGGVFEDAAGVKHYVKFAQKNPEQMHVEMLTDSIYRELGIGAKQSQVVRKGDSTIGLAGRMLDDATKMSEAQMAAHSDVLDGFVADAYLANWDVLGQGFDNVVASGGKAYRIDTGGSMFYRAQGGTKDFAKDAIPELDSCSARSPTRR